MLFISWSVINIKDLIKSWIFRLGHFLAYLKATQVSMILTNLDNSVIPFFWKILFRRRTPLTFLTQRNLRSFGKKCQAAFQITKYRKPFHHSNSSPARREPWVHKRPHHPRVTCYKYSASSIQLHIQILFLPKDSTATGADFLSVNAASVRSIPLPLAHNRSSPNYPGLSLNNSSADVSLTKLY